jgi:hypothetical protein
MNFQMNTENRIQKFVTSQIQRLRATMTLMKRESSELEIKSLLLLLRDYIDFFERVFMTSLSRGSSYLADGKEKGLRAKDRMEFANGIRFRVYCVSFPSRVRKSVRSLLHQVFSIRPSLVMSPRSTPVPKHGINFVGKEANSTGETAERFRG